MCNNAYAFFCIACNSFNLLHFTAKIYEILSEISSYINKNKKTIVAHQQINKEDLLALQQISQYIDEHYNFDISLDMLAKIACMSVSKMKILFKETDVARKSICKEKE